MYGIPDIWLGPGPEYLMFLIEVSVSSSPYSVGSSRPEASTVEYLEPLGSKANGRTLNNYQASLLGRYEKGSTFGLENRAAPFWQPSARVFCGHKHTPRRFLGRTPRL